MVRMFKDNLVLAVITALPMLGVAALAVFSLVLRSNVPPPHYDMLYVINYYEPAHHYQLYVEQGKLWVRPNKNDRPAYTNTPSLMLFEAGKKTSRLIPVRYPDSGEGQEELPRPVPEVAELVIDPSPLAPDGYAFSFRGKSSGVLGFFFSGYREGGVISKENYRVPIHGIYSSYNTRFLGWVVSGKQP